MKTRKNRLLLAAALLAAAVLLFCGLRRRDVYSYSAGVSLPEEYAAALAQGDTSAFAGQLVSEALDAKAVYPGSYTLWVEYSAAGAGSRVEVWDPIGNRMLGQAALDPAAGAAEVRFAVDKPVYQVVARCYAGPDGLLQPTAGGLASDGPVYTDAWWSLFFLLVFAAGGWLLWRKSRRGSARPLQLYLMAAAGCLPFFTAHLPSGHDLHFHLSRIYGLALALLDGQFPVRLNLDFWSSVGYINPILYPELFLYPSGVLCALGASVLLAYKMLMVGATFATVFVAYYAVRQMLGDRPALLFTVLYLLNPYRLNDFYIRAAVGEGLAMVFLPLAMVGIWQLMQGDLRKGFWCAVLGVTGVLQSHVITIFLVVVYAFVYVAGVLLTDGSRILREWRRLLTAAAAAGATVLLNLWFLLPFLTFSRWDLNIFHEGGQLESAWVYLPQAFMDAYAPGYDVAYVTQGGMSLSVGFAVLLGVLLFLLLLPRLDKPLRGIGLGCLGLGSLALFLCSDLFPWQDLQSLPALYALFSKQQFAWRGLSFVALFYCMVSAIALDALLRQKRQGIAAVVLTLAFSGALNASSGYLYDNATAMRSSSSPWVHDALYQGQYLLTLSDPEAVRQLAELGVTAMDSGAVTQWERQGATVTFTYEDAQPGDRFLLPLYGYANLYRASLADGSAATVSTGYCQMLQVEAPAAAGTITVRYYEPLRFRLASLVSLATAAGLAGWTLLRRRKEQASHGN